MDKPEVTNHDGVEKTRRSSHFREEDQQQANWTLQRAKFDAFDRQHKKAILRKVPACTLRAIS